MLIIDYLYSYQVIIWELPPLIFFFSIRFVYYFISVLFIKVFFVHQYNFMVKVACIYTDPLYIQVYEWNTMKRDTLEMSNIQLYQS